MTAANENASTLLPHICKWCWRDRGEPTPLTRPQLERLFELAMAAQFDHVAMAAVVTGFGLHCPRCVDAMLGVLVDLGTQLPLLVEVTDQNQRALDELVAGGGSFEEARSIMQARAGHTHDSKV